MRWEADIKEKQLKLERESQANNLVAATYDGYLNRITELNGMDMDDNARKAAIASITEGMNAMMATIAGLYPDLDIPSYGS